MLDRASTFSDPEVVELLRNHFIPVAIDQHYERRQEDAEGEFYRKIARQGPREVGEETTQGHYLATADGTLLGYRNHRDPEVMKDVIRSALKNFKPGKAPAIESGKVDTRWAYSAPEGGLVVRVNSKILGGYGVPESEYEQLFQEGIGRDNLWIRKDEHEALADGRIPLSLLLRMARFHFVDNTRGEPPMWEVEEVKTVSLDWREGHVEGRVHLVTNDDSREFVAEIYGFIEAFEGEVTRFDLVVSGDFRGEGRYTRGAPKGYFPLGIRFTLADGSDIADAIPPQGSRGWIENYIE
ncbi:MAG: hypothetical protein AAF357_07900 [Verrucomicrobiota bacterium]